MAVGMAMRGDGAGNIDKVHQPSAKKIAQRISVVGQHNFGHLGLRIAYWTRRKTMGGSAITVGVMTVVAVPVGRILDIHASLDVKRPAKDLELLLQPGLPWPPLKINLYIAFGLALKTGIAHRGRPVVGSAVIFKPAILHRFMEALAHVVEHDPGFLVACDGKTHAIDTTLSRYMATSTGIAQVAEVA
jgi:hypothetical protein